MDSQKRWEQLLRPDRFRDKANTQKHLLDKRTEFENDFFRLVLSSSFRRLQDKTQVFPLQATDFIRTRLTHSIEVSAIGRSIGRSVEEKLIEDKKLSHDKKNTISVILASTGLVHDIGNPPFGHFGETAIRDYFAEFFESTGRKAPENRSREEEDLISFTNQQATDFTMFDGNVQGFRILRKLQYLGDEFSYNLTFPTLATIVKYPHDSVTGNKGKSGSVSFKKFGYFKSEEQDFEKIDQALGLNRKRHPITFLLEAADDIAYSIADIEDGFKKGLISVEVFNSYMEKCLKKDPSLEEGDFLNSLKKIQIEVDKGYSSYEDIIIQKSRVAIQSFMIISAVESFLEHHDSIIDGQFDDELLSVGKCKRVKDCLGKLVKERILTSREILSLELIGHKVITALLGHFTKAVISEDWRDEKSKNGKLFNFVSPNFRHIFERYSDRSTYEKLRLVTDYISGMTDSYALDVYQKLEAIKL